MNILDLNKMQMTSSYFKKHFPELYDVICLLPPTKFQEKIYWYVYNLNEYPKCPVCNTPTQFINIPQGYRKYCSRKCLNTDPIKKQKTVETCIKLYGGPAPTCSEGIKEKAKMTCKEKYGAEYAMQSPEVQSRAIQGIRERLEKAKQTCMKKRHVRKSEELRQKKDVTYVEQYDNQDFGDFVQNILDEVGIEYETNKGIFDGQHADIWIPSLNFAIELNGTYHHSTLLKSPKYHINKFKTAQNKGIRLLTFWSDQIYNHPEIVKSMILTKLGKITKTIYARKCVIKDVDRRTAVEFLEANHIQGSTPTSIRYGLYFENELVALMTFSKNTGCQGSKYQKDWTLNRFCNKINMRVIGAAGKLLNHFIKTHSPETIISFSHNDISDGHLYEVLGFKSDHKINTSYYYVKGNRRWHRSTFTKAGIVAKGWKDKIDSTWTEREVMREHHFLCIYDSGTQKWIWTKKPAH